MYDIICVGDTTYDIFIKPHEAQTINSAKKTSLRIPYEKMLCFSYGDKIDVEEVIYSLGGTACNVAAGVKKLGLRAGLMSFCGADDVGVKIKQLVEYQGIELVNFITNPKIHSTYSFILRYKGDRTILVYRDHFDYSKLKLNKIKNTKWLYLSSLGEGYEKDAVTLASEKNIKIAMNPGKEQLEKKTKEFLLLLKLSEIVIINKEEAEILTDARYPMQMKEIFYKLAEFGAKNVIVTDGINGAYAKVDREIVHVSAIHVKAIEVTGAGDAFGAGFMASYIADDDIKKALVWGVINGGKVTEIVGAQNGILDRDAIKSISKKFKF